MSRVWAMPDSNTFSCKPIGEFVDKYADGIIVDPFARNSTRGTITNDLNPLTDAQYHMKADEFLTHLASEGVVADCVLLDPPYSPRQITECYSEAGLTATMIDTQASFWTKVRAAARLICMPQTVVLSFGWNSTGMGSGFEPVEIMLVAHGGAHNDTICFAEKMVERQEVLI